MRRLITLISAGRNRTIVIRRELPRTRDAGSGEKPYRIKVWRILLSMRPCPVTSTVALQRGNSSRVPAETEPATPSSQEMAFSHRRRVPSRPSGSERQRVAGSRRVALTGGADARPWNWREWQAWAPLRSLPLGFEFRFGLDRNGPNESQQLAAHGRDNLRLLLAGGRQLLKRVCSRHCAFQAISLTSWSKPCCRFNRKPPIHGRY